jgi:hypothetical protein
MNEDMTRNKSRKRWIIAILSVVFVLASLIYAWSVFIIYVGKGPTHPLTRIVDIAQGYATPENEYHGLPVRMTKENPVTCNSRNNKGMTLGFCVALFDRQNFWDCAWWRFEPCAVLEGEAYLLNHPKLLGRALAAVYDPCRYMPSIAEIKKNIPDDIVFQQQMMGYSSNYKCDGDHYKPGGYNYATERVFVKLFDEQGNLVFKLEKPIKN